MASLTDYLERVLKLPVNREKSAVDRPQRRSFLGFSFLFGPEAHIRLAPKTVARLNARIREITRRTRSMPLTDRIRQLNTYLMGWVAYFRLAHMKTHCERIDGWVRRDGCASAYGSNGNACVRAIVNSGHARCPSIGYTSWRTRGEDRGKWLETSITPLTRPILHKPDSRALQSVTNICVNLHEPPYADPLVRWCERSGRDAPSYSIVRQGYVPSLDTGQGKGVSSPGRVLSALGRLSEPRFERFRLQANRRVKGAKFSEASGRFIKAHFIDNLFES